MRLIVKGTLTLFLLLLISIPLSAQYVVQGVVTDSLTKEPLPYDKVVIGIIVISYKLQATSAFRCICLQHEVPL